MMRNDSFVHKVRLWLNLDVQSLQLFLIVDKSSLSATMPRYRSGARTRRRKREGNVDEPCRKKEWMNRTIETATAICDMVQVPRLRTAASNQVSLTLSSAYQFVYDRIIDPSSGYKDDPQLAAVLKHDPEEIRMMLGMIWQALCTTFQEILNLDHHAWWPDLQFDLSSFWWDCTEAVF